MPRIRAPLLGQSAYLRLQVECRQLGPTWALLGIGVLWLA